MQIQRLSFHDTCQTLSMHIRVRECKSWLGGLSTDQVIAIHVLWAIFAHHKVTGDLRTAPITLSRTSGEHERVSEPTILAMRLTSIVGTAREALR